MGIGTKLRFEHLIQVMVFTFFQFAVVIFIVSATVNGQRLSNKEVENFRIELEVDEKLARKCEQQVRNEQIKEFGKPLPKVSHICTSGCPVKIGKPKYPTVARQSKRPASVTVSVWIGLDGNVVRATAVSGPKIFHSAAVEAAYDSSFTPTVVCDGKKVRVRKTIRFDFRYN